MATSSSIFYRIIRAGIGVFSLFCLTKVMFVPKTSDTIDPSLHPTPKENKEIATPWMARFARIDSQIRANHLILANRFRVPELNPFFAKFEMYLFARAWYQEKNGFFRSTFCLEAQDWGTSSPLRSYVFSTSKPLKKQPHLRWCTQKLLKINIFKTTPPTPMKTVHMP